MGRDQNKKEKKKPENKCKIEKNEQMEKLVYF